MIGLGIALAKFTTGLTSVAGGILFVCIGITLVLYTGFRYFQVGNALRSGRFTVNVAGVSVILSLFLLVGFACLFFIIHQYLDPKDGR